MGEKVQEYSIRKTDIVMRCPHCKKVMRLGIAVFENDKKIHRGGK